MSKLLTSLRFLVITTVIGTPARADLITWGPVQDATGPSEVSVSGALVTAKKLWNTAPASPTVNGVLFAAFGPLGWGGGGSSLMDASTSGDAGYDALLNSARGTSEPVLTNPTGWGGIRIDNLGTLTLGTTYAIQVWFCDQRAGVPTNVLNDRVMTFSSATGVATQTGGIITNLGSLTQGPLSGPVEADPNNLAGAGDTIFGQYTIGTFTRTSADQIWLLCQGSHPLPSNVLTPHISALQIREAVLSTPSTPFCAGDAVGTTCLGCGNNGSSGRGCANSAFAAGALLTSSGLASVGADTLLLTATDVPGPGLFIQANGLAGTPFTFGDGMLCAAVGILRLGVVFPTAGVATYPGLNPAVSVAGGPIAAGDLKHYQCWYRDATPGFCTSSTFNMSNGVSLTWTP